MKLTDEMRSWLRRPENATLDTWTMIGNFIKEFGLIGDQPGILLKQWIDECYSMPKWQRTLGECAPTLSKLLSLSPRYPKDKP